MKNKQLLDIDSDYLISAFRQTTGTGLAGLMGGSVNHDQIQRLLAKERLGSAEWWQIVKPYVRQIQQDDGVIIIDDSIAEKPYTDENDIIGWQYSAAENMRFIKHDLDKDFIMLLKTNRKVALSEQAKRDGKWVRLDQLTLQANTGVEIDLESVDFPLLLVKQVCVNEDGSTGMQYLVSSDTTLSADPITTIYRKRWNVEPYHQALKQNASLEKSPTQTVTTQSKHLFAALCAYIKLEWLRKATQLNHFALKTKLYVAALHSAFATLQQFQPIQLAA